MEEPNGVRWDGVIPPDGLTVLYDPHTPLFDVVFVHGFTGHPERTWVHKKGDPIHQNDNHDSSSVEPPAKSRRLNLLGRSILRDHVHSAVYWPRDLLPQTVSNARVLTYGYDTRLRHHLGPSGPNNTVYDISKDFLVALEAKRRLESPRPILFIVHSLGGIVVKEMLRQSSLCQAGQSHLRDTFDSTFGIIFFGTPHRGADPRGPIHHVVETIIKACGLSVNNQIVNSLLPSAERLKQLRDEFGPMAIAEKWKIHSFQEDLGVKLLNGRKVVEDVSSLLNTPSVEVSEHIGRNHMDMCRFTGLEDVEYGKVAAALLRMTAMIPKTSVGSHVCSLNESQRQALMDSLKFEQIDARHMTIKRAHAKTCEWLLKRPEYLDWLDILKLEEHHGFLWIKGKPGAGKSTMMKFALGHCRKKMSDKIIISFFFNARGETLEKSTIGMYRSLCMALLEKVPILRDAFEFLGIESWNCSDNHQWSVDSLEELLGQAIQMLPQSTSVMCFIDALDECDEDSVRDMIRFFERLGENTISAGIKFQICFSSRHYPTITISKGLSLTLEGQEGHDQDIASYISGNLKIKKGKLAEQIGMELKRKAGGVFMWVVLVVDMLNKDYDKGLLHQLRARLREIPSDLNELFCNIVTRDTSNKEELLLCIQWLLFARNPLTPEEFYFAVIHGIQSGDELVPWDSEEIDIGTIETFISNASKGLAEVTKSKRPTVQFIHESVRDFLRTEEGLKAVSSDLGSNFEGESHHRLKTVCLEYLSIDISTWRPNVSSLPKASSKDATELRNAVSKAFPFFQYSVQNVLHHADSAQKNCVDQKDFIQSFQLAKWIDLDNIFQKHDTRRHSSTASLLYIFAEANLSNLIRIHSSPRSYFVAEQSKQDRYGLPILAALACDSRHAVLAFLEIEVDYSPQTPLLHDLCNEYRIVIGSKSSSSREFTYLEKKGPVIYFAEYGQSTVLRFLVATGHISKKSFSVRDAKGKSPLYHAVRSGQCKVMEIFRGNEEVDTEWNAYGGDSLHDAVRGGHEMMTQRLLETGQISVNSRDAGGLTPLMRAAASRSTAIVQLLLKNSQIDIDSRNEKGETALALAVRHAETHIIQILIDTGQVDVDTRDNDGRTPLSWACSRYFHEPKVNDVVQLLLQMDQVNFDSKDNSGRTPLLWAAQHSNIDVIQSLLKTGQVDVNSKDNFGQTPLLWAARYENLDVAPVLIKTGKADINSRDNSGRTPLSWAASTYSSSVTRLLLETDSVIIDSTDNEGRTPLFWAVESKEKGNIKLLLETKRVDIHNKDDTGQTPLQMAALQSRSSNGMHWTEDIYQMLLAYDQANMNSKVKSG